jgi:Tol biopolymer transport system component
MIVTKGVVLGPYEVLTHIGAGGMGEVWRARDRRIGRDVAVKVLPQTFAAGDAQVLRFEQEARAAGALNHPGLVTIFDVGTAEGSPYIVMELLEGETLRDVLGDVTPKPLPVRKVIDYAIQMASALATAHEKGIVHRDLKPENVFVTSEGRVKILDFGLAKLAGDAAGGDGRHKTARHLTSSGMVVGTPGYMSPEQVRAQPLDHRTDIFAFGAVVYEMLTGRRAFDRDSAVETMHAVLSDELPPLTSIDPKIPPALDAIVRHCMEKNPRERFQSARDLAFDLRVLPELQRSTTSGVEGIPGAKRRFPVAAAAGLLAGLALAAGGFALYRARAGGASVGEHRQLEQLTFASGVEMFPTLSPDGKTLVYVSAESGNRDIYSQRVDGRAAINLTKDAPDDDSEPAFSPDGSQIAFRSEREGGGIFVMGTTGESVRRVTDFGHNPSWSPDGKRIVVATERIELTPRGRDGISQLWIVDVQTGAKAPLIQAHAGGPDFGRDSDAVQPSWSPHGKRIAFWGMSDALSHRDLWTIDPNAPRPKETVVRVTNDPALDWNPVWSPDGKFLYFGSNRDGTMNLWRIAIDEDSGKPRGAPQPLSVPSTFSGHFAVSGHGEIAYVAVTRSYRLLAFPFGAKAATLGEPKALLEGSLEVLSFQASPDGQSIAFTTGGAQEDLFVANADGTRLRQLTNDAARDRAVSWSPDGKVLFFYSNRDGAYHVWSIHADGGGLARVTNESDFQQLHTSSFYSPVLSPDGRTLLAQTDGGPVLLHLDQPPGRRAERISAGDGGRSLAFGKWSPDGKLVLGALQGPDQPPMGFGVYSLQTHRFEKLLDHGVSPQWLPDMRVLFFETNRIGVLDLRTHGVVSIPFKALPGVDLRGSSYPPRISPDGSTLFVRQAMEQGDIWAIDLGGEG